jgi:hypothetical protein
MILRWGCSNKNFRGCLAVKQFGLDLRVIVPNSKAVHAHFLGLRSGLLAERFPVNFFALLELYGNLSHT